MHVQLSWEKTSVPWYIQSSEYGLRSRVPQFSHAATFTFHYLLYPVRPCPFISWRLQAKYTSFTIELPNPKSSDGARTRYEVAYRCGECTPMSTLKSAIEWVKRREKGGEQGRMEKGRITGEWLPTREKETDVHARSITVCPIEKVNRQCRQRDSIWESRKCYSRSTRYDPMAPNEDLTRVTTQMEVRWDFS